MEDVGLPTHQRVRHVQDFTSADTTASVSYGLAERVALEGTLVLRRLATTIDYEDAAGRPIRPAAPEIHHRNETLVGPGDPWVLGAFAIPARAWSLTLRAGVSVPLGRTEGNPFALGRRGIAHQHVQFGTGTWDPVLGIAAGRRAGAVALSATALARLPVADNAHGYRAGRRYNASLLADRAVGGGPWRAQAGLDYAREEAETWDGRVEEEGNLGRTDVLAALGLARVVGRATVSLTARIPVRTRAHGAQLDYPVVVVLGVGR